MTDPDHTPALRRRISAYEAEIVRLDRARDELKEAVIQLRMELERREKEALRVR